MGLCEEGTLQNCVDSRQLCQLGFVYTHINVVLLYTHRNVVLFYTHINVEGFVYTHLILYSVGNLTRHRGEQHLYVYMSCIVCVNILYFVCIFV